LSKIMREAEQPYTVHGFRSSFRDWAAENMPAIPDAVAEVALAHAVQDKVVAAYKRTEFIELRRDLLDQWSRFLDPLKIWAAAGAIVLADGKYNDGVIDE
jgi:integrase